MTSRFVVVDRKPHATQDTNNGQQVLKKNIGKKQQQNVFKYSEKDTKTVTFFRVNVISLFPSDPISVLISTSSFLSSTLSARVFLSKIKQ